MGVFLVVEAGDRAVIKSSGKFQGGSLQPQLARVFPLGDCLFDSVQSVHLCSSSSSALFAITGISGVVVIVASICMELNKY